MKKDTYYFSHDYNTTNDPKVQALLGKYGAKGYGIYWRVVEMLHEEPTHKLKMKPYIFEAIGMTFREQVEDITEILNYCISTCELFKKKGGYIYSERVLANIDKRDKIKQARSLAGKRSAEVRSSKATNEVVKQQVTNVKQTDTNKIKEKENKSRYNDAIDWNKLLSFFNDVFGKNNRVFNDANKGKYIARIKEGYSLKDICMAMKRCKADQFHKDNKYKYCTLEYFSRSTTLDKHGFDSTTKETYIPTK